MNKEELLFVMYKDTVETGNEKKRAVLKAKYPDVNISNLHIRIINYQVKKYGCSLNDGRANKEDYKAKMLKVKNRRRKRLGR